MIPGFFIFKNPEPKTEPGSMKTQKVVVIGCGKSTFFDTKTSAKWVKIAKMVFCMYFY